MKRRVCLSPTDRAGWDQSTLASNRPSSEQLPFCHPATRTTSHPIIIQMPPHKSYPYVYFLDPAVLMACRRRRRLLSSTLVQLARLTLRHRSAQNSSNPIHSPLMAPAVPSRVRESNPRPTAKERSLEYKVDLHPRTACREASPKPPRLIALARMLSWNHHSSLAAPNAHPHIAHYSQDVHCDTKVSRSPCPSPPSNLPTDLS